MDELPPIKLPKQFTGEGLEIIGNPLDRGEQFTLWFRDGRFEMLSLPSRESFPKWTPETSTAWEKAMRQSRAESLAMTLKDNPGDVAAAEELTAILKVCRKARPRERAAENAVGNIRNGGMPTSWPSQDRRERAAIIAIMQLCKEGHRPPTGNNEIDKLSLPLTGDVLIDRMKRLRDDIDPMKPFLTNDGDRKNLAKFLRALGLGWLGFRARGSQGGR